MAYCMVRYKVEDFDTWFNEFEVHSSFRKELGETSSSVFRISENSNEVVVLVGWDNRENLQKFMNDPNLKSAMEKGGVVGIPDIVNLEKCDRL